MSYKYLQIFSVFVSFPVKYFTKSDGINQYEAVSTKYH
jgi:hypothetical protein